MKYRPDDRRTHPSMRLDMIAKIFVSFVTISAVFLIISANGLMLDISKMASLNITYSLYESDGDRINYYVQVKNEGIFLIKDVSVTNILPPGLTYKPENQDSGSNFLLRCIENNENGTTKNLTWHLGSINTDQYKWLNFTLEKAHLNGNLSFHKIMSKGMALGYPVMGASPLEAEPYSRPITTEVIMGDAGKFTNDTIPAEVMPDNATNGILLPTNTAIDNISAEVA